MTVHIFGATSSSSCACFASKKTAEDRKGETTTEAARTIERMFCMDDCLAAVVSEEQGVVLFTKLFA